MKQFKFINDAFLPLIKKCPILNKLNLNQTLIKKIETRDEEGKKRRKVDANAFAEVWSKMWMDHHTMLHEKPECCHVKCNRTEDVIKAEVERVSLIYLNLRWKIIYKCKMDKNKLKL